MTEQDEMDEFTQWLAEACDFDPDELVARAKNFEIEPPWDADIETYSMTDDEKDRLTVKEQARKEMTEDHDCEEDGHLWTVVDEYQNLYVNIEEDELQVVEQQLGECLHCEIQDVTRAAFADYKLDRKRLRGKLGPNDD